MNLSIQANYVLHMLNIFFDYKHIEYQLKYLNWSDFHIF